MKIFKAKFAPGTGFEPVTNRLTGDCSTAELSRNISTTYIKNRGHVKMYHILCLKSKKIKHPYILESV